MIYKGLDGVLETKFNEFDLNSNFVTGTEISGYASIFGTADQGGDVVQAGAYSASLEKLREKGRNIKMLWQHDPTCPIGVWEEVKEDTKGLFVRGRILTDIQAGREALALIEARAIDGLSIGYRTVRAQKNTNGGRKLHELDIWEVSLVTFPMLPDARVEASDDNSQLANDLAAVIADARRELLM